MKLLTNEQKTQIGFKAISAFWVTLACTIAISIGITFFGFMSRLYFFLKPFLQ